MLVFVREVAPVSDITEKLIGMRSLKPISHIAIRLRYNYDTTIPQRIRLRWTQSNRNFDHFRRSRMRRGFVVS